MTEPAQPVTLTLLEAPDNPHRLGRHVAHDPRSRRFAFGFRPEAARKVESRPSWTRRIPVLDQGALGSCTGHAGAGWVGTDTADRAGITRIGDPPFAARRDESTPPVGPVDETWAVALYSAATVIDPFPGVYPPQDTGSDGLSIAKVLEAWGLVAEYTWGFGGLTDVVTGLQSGVVLLGTVWYSSMFYPTPSGELVITADAYVAGGHEYVADGELDVDQRRVWITNSWGDWGIDGRAWLSFDTLGRLLAEQGDAVMPHATAVIDPEPEPGPEPQPARPGCMGRLATVFRRR